MDVNAEITRRFKPTLDRLCYLYDRWQDEKQYEDWSDYLAEMKKSPLPDGSQFVKATKTPFAMIATMGNGQIKLFVNSRKAGWQII